MSIQLIVLISISVLANLSSLPASAQDQPNGAGATDCSVDEWRGGERLSGRLHHTVDGDTAHVVVGSRRFKIRFLGIDTPETNFNGKSQGYWAELASSRLAELLPVNAAVELVLGAEPCDHYGRMLAHVYRGDMHVNRQMIVEGLAVNYCIFPETDCQQFADIVDANVAAGRGMFGDSSVELPYEWRRRESGRPFEKFVGNMFSHEVFAPGSYDRVSVGQRIFFFEEADIRPPYRLVR